MAVFTKYLNSKISQGWILLNIPLKLPITSIPNCLMAPQGNLVPGVDFDILEWFNPSDGDWKIWASFKPPPLNDYTDVLYWQGFWIHVLQDCILKVEGDFITETDIIPLRSGVSDFNLVGYPLPSRQDYTFAQMKTDTGVIAGWKYDPKGEDPSEGSRLRALLDSDILRFSNGYWFNAPSNYDWTEWYSTQIPKARPIGTME